MIERKIFSFIGNSIKYLNSSVGILKKNRSPNIAHVQQHFDLFDDHKKFESSLQKSGYLNIHLCLNAEMDRKHTECDSSYTVISVPAHSKEKQPVEYPTKVYLNLIYRMSELYFYH